MPRSRLPHSAVAVLAGALAVTQLGCSTVDPGPNFVVTSETFNEDFFYCHVEPELLVAKKCGGGDTAAGDPAGACHFNPSAVSGMALVDHPAITCDPDHPTDRTQIVQAAKGNFQAASIEMSRDVATAPIFVRPSGNNHPRAVFAKDDQQVITLLQAWAQK